MVSFTGVFDHSLWTPDEPRDAEVGREMLVGGDYLVPTIAGEPFLEKPPIYWWAMVGLYRTFAVSDGVARTTSALAGVLALLLVFDLGRRVSNPLGGLMSVIVVSTMSGFFYNFHRVVVDPFLALFLLIGYWGFVRVAFGNRSDGEKPARPPFGAIFLIYVAAGLSFLAKGLIGPVLLAGPIVPAVILGRRRDLFRSPAHFAGMAVFIVLCAVWPLGLYSRGGAALLKTYLLDNLVYRVLPGLSKGAYRGGHREGPLYYFAGGLFFSEIAPWIVAVPAMIHWLWRKRMPAEWNYRAILFLSIVFPVGLLILSVPGTKRSLYLLPMIASLGIAVGAWLAATARKEFYEKMDRCTHVVLLTLIASATGAAFIALPFADKISMAVSHRHLHDVLGPISPVVWGLLAMLAGLILILTICGVRLRKLGSPRLGSLTAWMVLALFVLGSAAIYRAVDPAKNLHSLPSDLKQMGALTDNTLGYCLDETTRCLIPFDTGFTLKHTDKPEELLRFLKANPSGLLLVLERDRNFIPETLRADLRLVRKWSYDKHREYGLYSAGKPAPATAALPLASRRLKVLIDPGHGGKDPGATGRGGLREKDVTLEIARKLADYLQQKDIRVVLTRQSDVSVSLEDRVAVANRGRPDLFISIHANSNKVRSLSGAMTLYPYDGPAERYLNHSEEAANLIESALEPVTGHTRKNNGVVEDLRGLEVLREIQAPAVLVEVDFLSNRASERKLASAAYCNAIANAIGGAAAEFLRSSK